MTNGTPQLDLGDQELAERVAAGLDGVEKLMFERLSSGHDFLNEKVTHLAKAGGKRFRPMMAMLASEFGDQPQAENVVKGATIVEMVHLATLYHDDVMDEAAKRRGVDSANARWTNTVAILSGDFLLAEASRIMSEIDTATVAHFADTFSDLVTGQMRETVGPGEGDPVEHYLNVIREKTGVLIASAAFLGATHSGAKEEDVRTLKELGEAVGMIFQIVDDIIDIFSDSTQSGKTPGTDLREGVFTLPVLYAMRDSSPAGEELRAMLTGPLIDDADVARALDLIAQTDGRQRALDDVRGYLADVDKHLDALPDIPANRAIRQISRYTVERVG
ncbi:polyprenyl synthetase family protein [Corynebacterium sp. CCUG 65737]|uniref:polyprenyl synthetase family protein n=1 Tax=Corynebacterium sp. CCUG 65737 TaxID=2823889 RepID=UPI002109ADED|nr:polyprenyl synthetase family protein [Corynebacterium sp. CCUG 65737]MCQ4626366.1 polyprenyl synthetase family protein [Corynebacterium sp. CCUG 65737]